MVVVSVLRMGKIEGWNFFSNQPILIIIKINLFVCLFKGIVVNLEKSRLLIVRLNNIFIV